MNPHQRLTPMFGTGVATQDCPQKSVEEQGNATQPKDMLPDLSQYTLTVGEAASVMLSERCKFASERKVQRLCKNADIDCYKLTTTRGGQPVSEWLVNEASLLERISEKETKVVDGVASHPPNQIGDANETKNIGAEPDVMASPNALGDAKRTGERENEVEDVGNDGVPPELDGDATGETRTMASVLIENAQLTSALEGKDELLDEIRSDKDFYKEELREARQGRNDVTSIAERMLETLETIAAGRTLLPHQKPHPTNQSEVVSVTPIEPETQNE